MQTKKIESFKRRKRVKEAHRLREEKGLPNVEIAKRLGVSLDTVNDYFRTHKRATRVNAQRISNQIVGLFIDQGMTIQEIMDELHVSQDLVQVCIQSYPYLIGGGDDKKGSIFELRREISILRKQIDQLQSDLQKQRSMILELRRSDPERLSRISGELDERLKKARRKYIDGEKDEEEIENQLSNRRSQRATRRTYRPIT
jgi:AcrR family transcriptional regulator